MSILVEISTIFAAAAGLWGLGIAWLAYRNSIIERKHVVFEELQSICRGLRSELDLMKFWSGSYSTGYSQKMKPEDGEESWSYASRLIWKFPYDTVRELPQSPLAIHLREIVQPFLKLSFSVSKFFQFYDEYRKYALSKPNLYHEFKIIKLDDIKGQLTNEQQEFRRVIRDLNFRLHVHAIGGEDSTDEDCLYLAHKRAFNALNDFERGLKEPTLPWVFKLGNAVAYIFFVFGLLLVLWLGLMLQSTAV